ncbi:1-deoxyxylulose-5-phosphate synthase YajO [Geodia barretti]|uniref:1-deoxyxylulose-5-phosphate synthase YajO n=1 Tax=Geodia barretti TaxID=519541 RepID=A0AA35WIC6_GEOBA|nr:1-deoxyxylulose-5-phosphate synthase YajO [Geodia barretti]
MEYVNLGRTGLRVSRLCLGTMTFGSPAWRPWILPEDASRPFIRRALDAGINFFDTADMYSRGVSEEIVGRALDDFTTRDQAAARGTDYVDLYQIHRFDSHTPIEETLEALDAIVRAGKARYIGASSMYAWQFAQMLQVSERRGWARFVSMQTTTTSSTARKSARCFPCAAPRALASFRGAPWRAGSWPGTASGRPVRRTREGGDTLRAQTDEYAQSLYYADADFRVVDRVVELARRHGG